MPRVKYVLVHRKRSGSVLDVAVDMEGFWARGWDDEMQLDTPRAMVVMKTSFASWNSDEIRLERVRPPASSVEDGGVVCLHGKIGRGHQRPRKGEGKTEGQESAAELHQVGRKQKNMAAAEQISGEKVRQPGGALERAFWGK